jgi:hypothetical protein
MTTYRPAAVLIGIGYHVAATGVKVSTSFVVVVVVALSYTAIVGDPDTEDTKIPRTLHATAEQLALAEICLAAPEILRLPIVFPSALAEQRLTAFYVMLISSAAAVFSAC